MTLDFDLVLKDVLRGGEDKIESGSGREYWLQIFLTWANQEWDEGIAAQRTLER